MLYNKRNFTVAIDQSFLNFKEPKTKLFLQNIRNIDIDHSKKILIIMAKKNWVTYLTTRNLQNIEIIAANQLNLLSIIKAKYILIDINAITIIEKIYNG